MTGTIIGGEGIEGKVSIIDLEKRSGLPLVCLEIKGDYSIAIKDESSANNFHILKPDVRRLRDMAPVVTIPESENAERIIYKIYRNVHSVYDEETIIKNGLRFDITVLFPGHIGNERHKTLGHHHPPANAVIGNLLKHPDEITKIVRSLGHDGDRVEWLSRGLYEKIQGIEPTEYTFPELYQVLHGNAIYLLQNTDISKGVHPVGYVEAQQGDIVLVPPSMGHVTINPTEELLVMADWVASFFQSDYSEFFRRNGAAFLFTSQDGWVANKRYSEKPTLAKMPIHEPWMPRYFTSKYPLYSLISQPENLSCVVDPMKLLRGGV